MRLGATLAHLSPAPPFAVAEWARRLVGEGFESLWTPQVIGRGFLVPDPFVTLAVAATATEGVEVGTATVQVPLHHPADLAHRVLSLMSVCGDRLTLGVSPGSTDARLRHLRPGLRRALPNLRREPGAAAGPARPRAGRARRPRPRRHGHRRAAASPRLVGCQGRAGRPGVRRLAGLRLPPHGRPDHRRPRTVPGRRWPTGDRVRHPAVRTGRPRTHRRAAPALCGGRLRRRRRADRTGRAGSRTGQSPPPG